MRSRFRRVAALQRHFVDREEFFADFSSELEHAGGTPRVLNIVGVGGVGKSRLLRELRERVKGQVRTASLDLQVPVMREAYDALAVLRSELGKQHVDFDRFDIAYAVLWQRLHPNVSLSRRGMPLAGESEILAQILDDASGIPVVGTAVGIMKLLSKSRSGAHRRNLIRHDETLHQLDELESVDLIDAVTYLFAEDLREASTAQPFVIFVDAYEALTPAPASLGRPAGTDAWLRDLVSQLDSGLVVIASREPLGWEVYEREWAGLVKPCPLDGLPMEARLELLASNGVTEITAQRAIAQASAGVPFYLHLAVDTQAESATTQGTELVSSEQILDRFLKYVRVDEVRILELLSLARIFDFRLFRGVTEKFHLPGNRVVWDSLVSYSFVYPAAENGMRLHQLMAGALRARLSARVVQEIHQELCGLWDSSDADDTAHGDDKVRLPVGGVARECVYHGVHAGSLTGAQILEYADRTIRRGGKQAADGMLRDLQDYLAERTADRDVRDAALCLEAEAAILLGDASRARELTSDSAWPVSTTVGARLAVAAAHARRIAGYTHAALRIYTTVWDSHRGATRLIAGLWAADLHMCQGRFRDADAMAMEITEDCPPDNFELLGDVARLRHLAARFAYDYDQSHRYLEIAEQHHQASGSVIGRANLLTNRAELLALTNADAAVSVAEKALETQQELAAQHEIGKAYTALALAQLRLGQLDHATESLRLACEALEKAKYRSGRARAELVRAVLLSRREDINAASQAARWAVTELEETDVYPTLILVAAKAMSVWGQLDAGTAAAAERSRSAIQPLHTPDTLDARIDDVVTDLLSQRR